MRRAPGIRIHTLFGVEEPPINTEQQRGRDADLLDARNEHLLHRYEYYRQDKRNDYDWILGRLSTEFYLKPFTVGWLISENSDRLAQIRAAALTTRELRKRWGWMVWE